MTLEEIQKHFDDVSVRDGDMGQYAEIRIFTAVYVHVFLKEDRDTILVPQLFRNQEFVTLLLGVKNIEDLVQLSKLIKGY